MKITKRLSIITGCLGLIAFVSIMLFTILVRDQVVSTVAIQDSSLTAVVTSDIAGCYYCQLFEHGNPISDRRILGPYVSGHCSLAKMITTSNIVEIEWTDGGNHYNTSVDVAAHCFVTYSNSVPVQ